MSAPPLSASAPAPSLTGRLADLRRHPLKGFTAERLEAVTLSRGKPFPHDRLYAVEAGDCGFEVEAPRHISKFKFAVLANTAAVAKVTTAYDPEGRRLKAQAPEAEPFAGDFADPADRDAFVRWLHPVLGEDAPEGALRVVPGQGWRFFDAPDGHISVVNLESVRDLARHVGAPLDPLRFRANLYLEGWPAWTELDLPAGARVRAGEAALTVVRPIRRCAAIHVDPVTAERDHDLVRALFTAYGHMFCGTYLQVEAGGRLAIGDAVETMA